MMINQQTPPSYDQALNALATGDDETLADILFAFELSDGYYVERVSAAMRTLLLRPDLTPAQIVAIGRALHALGRMPLRTPGIDLEISLGNEMNGEAMSWVLILKADYFSTQSGGYVNGGFGTDSVSGPTYEVSAGGRSYDGWVIENERWPDIFAEASGCELRIYDDSQDELLDWQHPDGSPFWEWIAQHE